jgi:UDPglucose--hexose-1-phosphate uridylyltransferase
MSELRRDPITGRWVIIATDRARRAADFVSDETLIQPGPCPFCKGNESKTPYEIAAYREMGAEPNKPGWRVRVIPNKFPALRVEGDLDRRGDGIYDLMNGLGAHEVIIESPQHVASLTSLDRDNIQEILWMYRDRLNDLKRDMRLIHGVIFKNVGKSAGATMEHTNSQLIATTVIPITVQVEMDGALEFFKRRERCVFCDILRQEIADGGRVVERTHNFAAIEPYAARFPFETWILPLSHSSNYEFIQRSVVGDLADILKSTLGRIETALSNPPYNFVLHSGPFKEPSMPHYHWHIEIIPRVTRVAGFEWGTGFYINPVSPEEAAGFLKEVK